MQFSTLVTLTTLAYAATVVGTNNNPSTITACQTITSTVDYSSAFGTCTVLACLEVKPITQKCGCSTIPTVTVPRTACPTSCGSTSYITAVEDCFPTPPPSSHSSSSHPTTTTTTTTTTSSTHPSSSSTTGNPPSSSHPPPSSSTSTSQSPPPTHSTPSLTPTSYTNSTTTKTTTDTDTNPPSVSTTTVLPPTSRSATTVTTIQGSNTPPSPSSSPSPTFRETNVAAGRWGLEAALGAVGMFIVMMLGMV